MSVSQITIMGVGLLGGSFALALRKSGFRGRIVGADRAAVLEKAEALGAVDSGNSDPVLAAQGSQIVVLATPVGAIIDLIERLGPVLPAATLLTDVGSTKAEIAARARAVFGAAADERFLPGHPIAGKEHSGLEHAEGDLFRGAPWLFTPSDAKRAPSGLHAEFIALVEGCGARVAFFDPQKHDAVCAWVSHLPQMVSTAFSAMLMDEFEREGSSIDRDAVKTVNGRAMREMTRIAASPFSMWRDIALTNGPNIEAALLRLEQRLAHIRENLRTPGLREEFEKGNRFSATPAPPQPAVPAKS